MVKTDEQIRSELKDMENKLKMVTRSTGRTNFEKLYQDNFFRNMFPLVTEADSMLIDEMLKEIGRYRRY